MVERNDLEKMRACSVVEEQWFSFFIGLNHSAMPYIRYFHELESYKAAMRLSRELYHISIHFPRDEKFSLTDQMRRASRSVGAQIAEAWAKRKYIKHFSSKLTDTDGEQLETQHWINVALDCSYISAEKHGELIKECNSVGRMLNSMILKAHQFCQTPPSTE